MWIIGIALLVPVLMIYSEYKYGPTQHGYMGWLVLIAVVGVIIVGLCHSKPGSGDSEDKR